jgi:hypothetical protein
MRQENSPAKAGDQVNRRQLVLALVLSALAALLAALSGILLLLTGLLLTTALLATLMPGILMLLARLLLSAALLLTAVSALLVLLAGLLLLATLALLIILVHAPTPAGEVPPRATAVVSFCSGTGLFVRAEFDRGHSLCHPAYKEREESFAKR